MRGVQRWAVNTKKSFSEFFDNQLKDPNTAWSVGSFGAIAEFMRDPDEPVTFRRNGTARSAVTARGGILVDAQVGSRLIASESPTVAAWSHRVALCMPLQLCAMNRRLELTEIGPDIEALRSEDRSGILFDLGLGLLQVDAFVRINDPAVASALRRHAGKSVFATDSRAMAVILDVNPHRVFVSRAGRVEVFQGIPPPDGKVLKVRTRMFCPNYSHTAGLIPRLSHCQTGGCPALIAIHPIPYVMAKAAAVHLTPTVILPSRRCWNVTATPSASHLRSVSLVPLWRATNRSLSNRTVIVSGVPRHG